MGKFFDKSKTSAYAELEIWGETVDPKAVSEILGITPYKIRNVGELGEYTRKPNTVASWIYRTEEKETECISEQLEELRSVFEGKAEKLDKIRQLFVDCTIDVCIVLYNRQKILPGFLITAQQISFLASIGVYLDFDIYHNQN